MHHWRDAGVASWYDFAVAIAEEAQTLGLLERPVRDEADRDAGLSDAGAPARLQPAGLHRNLGELGTPPHWRAQLQQMLGGHEFRLPTLSHQHSLANFALLMAIGLWAVLAVAMLFVMSLGTDEAWVLNGLRSTLRPVVPGLTTEIISTSGGVFAIANLLVEWVAGSQAWLHRLVSLFFLLLAVVMIVRVARSADSPRWELGLLAVPMLALPGTVEVGTAALGTSTGLSLMVASLVVWAERSKSTRRRVIQAGVLYGLAAASRFDLVLVGGALLLCGTLRVSQKDGIELRFDSVRPGPRSPSVLRSSLRTSGS